MRQGKRDQDQEWSAPQERTVNTVFVTEGAQYSHCHPYHIISRYFGFGFLKDIKPWM